MIFFAELKVVVGAKKNSKTWKLILNWDSFHMCLTVSLFYTFSHIVSHEGEECIESFEMNFELNKFPSFVLQFHFIVFWTMKWNLFEMEFFYSTWTSKRNLNVSCQLKMIWEENLRSQTAALNSNEIFSSLYKILKRAQQRIQIKKNVSMFFKLKWSKEGREKGFLNNFFLLSRI